MEAVMETAMEFLAAADALKQSHPEVLVPAGWLALALVWLGYQLVRPVKFGKIADMMANTMADPGAKWQWLDRVKKSISCVLPNGERLVIEPAKRSFEIGSETVTSLLGRRERRALCRRAGVVIKRLQAQDYAESKRKTEQKVAQMVNRMTSESPSAKYSAYRAAEPIPTVQYVSAEVKKVPLAPSSEYSNLLSLITSSGAWRAGMSKGKPTGNSIVLEHNGSKYVVNFKTKTFEKNGIKVSLHASEKETLMKSVYAIAGRLGLAV